MTTTFLILLGGDLLKTVEGTREDAQAVVNGFAYPAAFTIVPAEQLTADVQAQSCGALAALASDLNVLPTDQQARI